jgi:hypothetical protein
MLRPSSPTADVFVRQRESIPARLPSAVLWLAGTGGCGYGSSIAKSPESLSLEKLAWPDRLLEVYDRNQ